MNADSANVNTDSGNTRKVFIFNRNLHVVRIVRPDPVFSVFEYLLPMASEMPDIEVGHIKTPTKATQLGAKGCGEAGIIAVCSVVINGINDALEPFGVEVSSQPFTPEKILRALGKVS